MFARRQQRLARVADNHVHLRIAHRVVVDRSARACDVQDQRLELDDVDAFDRGHRGKPSRGAARPEPDDQRALRAGMAQRAKQSRASPACLRRPRRPVRLAVDEEGVAARIGHQRDAALDAVAVPRHRLARRVQPVPQPVGVGQTRPRWRGPRRFRCGATRPSGRWPSSTRSPPAPRRHAARARSAASDRIDSAAATAPSTSSAVRPAATRLARTATAGGRTLRRAIRQSRQSCSRRRRGRSGGRARRGRGRAARSAAGTGSRTPSPPAARRSTVTTVHPKTLAAKPAARRGSRTIARSARRSPSANAPAMASASSRQVKAKPSSVGALSSEVTAVDQPADADSGERDGEHEPEGEYGTAKQRSQHPVPHQLHQKEREPRPRPTRPGRSRLAPSARPARSPRDLESRR